MNHRFFVEKKNLLFVIRFRHSISVTFCLITISLSGTFSNFPSHTAIPLVKGQKEVGVFQPLRLGIGENTEISTHPLAFFVIPNMAIKHCWISGKWTIATRHSLHYPTPFLRIGRGFIQPSTAEIPHVIANNHQILATKRMGQQIVTFKMGIQTALRWGSLKGFRTFDIPIVTPRTAIYHKNPTFHWGLDMATKLSPKLDLLIDFDHFVTSCDKREWAIESKTMILWKKSENFSVFGGIKMTYGNYPWGNAFQKIPLIDFIWKLKQNWKKDRKGSRKIGN